MDKLYAAIGNFYNDESVELIDVPADEEEIYAKVEEIMALKPRGYLLKPINMEMLLATVANLA